MFRSRDWAACCQGRGGKHGAASGIEKIETHARRTVPVVALGDHEVRAEVDRVDPDVEHADEDARHDPVDVWPRGPGETEATGRKEDSADRGRVQAHLWSGFTVARDGSTSVQGLLDGEVEDVGDCGADKSADQDGSRLTLGEAVRDLEHVRDGANKKEYAGPCQSGIER